MEKKWNLQDIRPSEKRRPPARSVEQRMSVQEPAVTEMERERRPRDMESSGKGRRTGFVLALVVFLIVTVGGLILAMLTAGAEVTVFPRFREPTINGTFEAKRNASSGELPFEMLTLEADGEREVTATGQEDVETQATGVVTIFNTSSGEERLIKNTRLATPEGLIFRITESVVLPGSTSAGPGKATASVFSDVAGTEYNVAANTRFTVPGFKENDLMDLYNAIYAENPTAFTGGYKGPRYIIDESELGVVTESLQAELRQALQDRVNTERPAGFTLFQPSITFVYRDMPSEDVGSGKVKLKKKAVLQAPMFKNENFASYLAASSIPGYENEPVRIEDVSTLNFEYATSTGDLAAAESISFKLSGQPKLIWTYDAEQLKKDLAGGAQTSLNTVLGGYPAIERATAAIRPFWKRSYPDDPADITIVEKVGPEEE